MFEFYGCYRATKGGSGRNNNNAISMHRQFHKTIKYCHER